MSNSYSTTDLEARIAELESQLEKQDNKIKTVAVVMSAISPFSDKSPVERFFADVGFWDLVEVDNSACISDCYKRYTEAKKSFTEARDKLIACREACGGFEFPPELDIDTP